MEIENIEKTTEINKMEKFDENFKSDKFDEKTFFRLGQSMRTYWPHDIAATEFKVPALSLTEWGLKNNEIIFEVTNKHWLDPYSTFFSFYVQNNSDYPIQLDDSIHSLFSKIVIYVNGVETEVMDEYPVLSKVYFDMTLSQSEREKRRPMEGWGKNSDGSDELIIDPARPYVESKKTSEDNDKCVIKNVGDPKNSKDINWGYLFKIPFLSKFFGHKIEEKNWRLLPMRNMKITIKLVTNPYAFYRPYSHTPNNKTIPQATPIDRIKIIHPKFCFTEYTISQEYDQMLYNRFSNTELVYDFVDYEILTKHFLLNESVELSLKFKPLGQKQGVRGLLFFVHDNTYKSSAYAKPLARINMGFSTMQVYTRFGNWPNNDFFKYHEIHNANVDSIPSCKPLLKEIEELQVFKTSLENDKRRGVFSEVSLSRKWDISHLIARASIKNTSTDDDYLKVFEDPYNVKKHIDSLNKSDDDKEKLNKKIGNLCLGKCNTMLVIKFDNIPTNKDKMIAGIDLQQFDNNVLTLKKNEASMNLTGYEYLNSRTDLNLFLNSIVEQRQDIQKTSYLVAQIYKRVKMDVNGNLTFLEL